MSTSAMPDPMGKRLGYVLKRAQHALRIRMDDALRPLELTAPQYAVLSAIELEPGISSAALARAAFVTAQTMHGIVANLARRGLLQRVADPAHGRVLRGKLTRRGQDTIRKAHDASARVERVMTASISAAEAAMLTDLLSRCAGDLSISANGHVL